MKTSKGWLGFFGFFLSGALLAQAEAQPVSLIPTPSGAPSLSSAVPKPVLKASHKHPASAKVKTEWTASPTPILHPWVLDIGPEVSLPVQNWNAAYTFGYGNCLRLSYRFDPQWTLGLGLDYDHFDGTNYAGTVSDNDLRVLPRLLYYFGQGKFRFYGILEAGTIFQFAHAPLAAFTNINFDGAAGLGMELALGSQDSIFLEARYNLILADNILGQDIPLCVGYRAGL